MGLHHTQHTRTSQCQVEGFEVTAPVLRGQPLPVGPLSVSFLDRRQGYNKDPLDMDFRIIFVVTRSTAPPNGELVGDVLYVNVPDGYQNIVYKVKHMMGLVR